MSDFQNILIEISCFIIVIGILQNLIYLLQIPLAFIELRRLRQRDNKEHSRWLVTSAITMPISILVPAYNEEVSIVENVSAILTMQYPEYEVIVINDGSKDQTLQKLIDAFGLIPSKKTYEQIVPHKKIKNVYVSQFNPDLIVIDKDNGGGKADATNAGISVSRYPIFCTVDADSLLEPSALLKTIQPFIDDPERVVAVGGTVRIINGCRVENGEIKEIKLSKKLLPLFQTLEYIRAFLMGRLAFCRLKIVTIISGAFGVFKKDAVLKVGGYSIDSIGEDYELVLKLHKYFLKNKEDYEVKFIPEPVCWTEVPESLKSLRSQRIRWQQGALEGFFKHIEMFMNPKYGRIGMLGFLLSFIFDILGPLAELFGYVLIIPLLFMGKIGLLLTIDFFIVFFVFGVFISVMSLILEEISLKRFKTAEDLLTLGLIAIAENFGYRVLNNIWRIMGCVRFLRRDRSWGEMVRVGHEKT